MTADDFEKYRFSTFENVDSPGYERRNPLPPHLRRPDFFKSVEELEFYKSVGGNVLSF
jgi:hypothetical protein